jgi:uncharacterized Tic20 family protein
MPQVGYLKVKKFGPVSVAKIFAVLGVIIGVIVVIVGGITGALKGPTGAAIGLAVGLVILIALAIGLFLGGAIEAWLYNAIVKIVGPIRISITKKGVISKVDPLSYAKVAFVFSLIIFVILAVFGASALLATIGVSSAVGIGLSLPLIAAAFVFALLVYGFILPLVWATVYNWLAETIGGVAIVLKKGIVESVDISSYVKIIVTLSVIIFVVEKAIGTVVGFALGIPQTGGILLIAGTFVGLVIVSIVGNAILAFLYNKVAKKIGGIQVDISK